MYYRSRAILLLLIIFATLVSAPAMAFPILFTDRTAFDAAVGPASLVTFDIPAIFEYWTRPDGSIFPDFGSVTIDGLLTTGVRDREHFVGINNVSGSFCFCSNFGPGGFGIGTIDPVLAFGVDITPLEPNALISFGGLNFLLTKPQFLGVLFSVPTITGVSQTFGLTSPSPAIFSIDNVAIKTVPEPSSLILFGLGLVLLMAWRGRQRIFNPKDIL